MNPESPYIVELPKITDPRGNLSFIQDFSTIPFKIRRAYWIYDVPGGEVRHGHAFRKNTEIIIALSGSFDVVVSDKNRKEKTYHLCRGYYGLVVPAGNWRRLDNFSTNSVAFVLSSTLYDADDYIYDFERYLRSEYIPPIPDEDKPDYEKSATDPHLTSTIDECRIVELPRNRHSNGSLTVVENTPDSLLPIARTFYLYDVPGDSERGGHSHFDAREYIIAASGCFDVTVRDGIKSRTFTLRRPYQALYIPAGIWRTLDNFSSGSVTLVLTTHLYSESDYVRDFDEFNDRTSSKTAGI